MKSELDNRFEGYLQINKINNVSVSKYEMKNL